MAQQARDRQSLTIAPRYQKPPGFSGSEVAWRSLCDTYPSAENPEVLLALMEYCAVRHLDPYKRPCHVVPMWNTKLRRRVQVIMQGINEVEITASRTGKWAGMDAPEWGPPAERTFRGEIENEDGSKAKTEVTLQYPVWCSVTVYRMVDGQRVAFTEQLFWDECYAKAGFRSEVPNARWQQAPRQMLHKCVKAAVLRAAFPEEGLDYTRDEMEDREIDSGGVIIEGKAEQPASSQEQQEQQEQIRRDRQADEAYPGTTPGLQPGMTIDEGGKLRLDVLEEPNGTLWFKHLRGLLDAAANEGEVVEIENHRSVDNALAKGSKVPVLIQQNIHEALRKAHERFKAKPFDDEAPPPTDTTTQDQAWDSDPIGDLLLEIVGMDLVTVNGLQSNATWRNRVRNAAADFPPDEDRINEAIEARKLALKAQGGKA